MAQLRDNRGRFAGSGYKLTWNGNRIARSVRSTMQSRLAKIGELVASEVRKRLSTSTRAAGPSIPGDFPHADTGTLGKSISYEVTTQGGRLICSIGTPVEYAPFLEEDGIDKMAARPFLLRTILELRPKIEAILGEPINISRK